MNELLIKLKKAVDRAVDTHGATREVTLAELPGHVLKSLEVILADPDEERAVRRLALLKASVDEVCVIAKQSMGTGEDLETQRVHVVVYDEPAGASTPAGEKSAEGSGTPPVEQNLGQAIETLKGEMAALKRALGVAEEDRAQGAGAGDANARTAKAEDRGGAPEEDDDDDDEEEGKRKEDAEGKRKAKGKEDAEGKAKGEQVAKAVAWPLDLNTSRSGSAPVRGANDDFDWGTDPDLGPARR